MLKSIATCLLAFAALTSAGPIEPRATSTSSGTANFDRISAFDHPEMPVGYYGGLFWTGVYAVNASDTTQGLAPRSLPNLASFGSVTADLPIISSVYKGSGINSFKLSSLYLGCSNEAGTVPVPCKVSVYTYDKSLKLLSYSPFYFTPQTNKTSKLLYADLSSTPSAIQYARFITNFVNGTRGLTSIDDVKYSITTNGTSDAKTLVAS